MQIRLTDVEIAEDLVFMHSDIYEGDDGKHWWTVDHPSGWSASGRSDSLKEALKDAEKSFHDGLRESGYDIQTDGKIQLLRVHND